MVLRWFIGISILIAVWAACVVYARGLFLHPTTHPISARGAVRRVLPSGIEIWLSGDPNARALMLAFYGNGSRAEEWVGDVPAGMQLWGVNYPGFGGSQGSASLTGVMRAADEAAAAIFAEGKPVLVAGSSMGTTAALRVAATRPVAGVYLRNPPGLKQLVVGEFRALLPLAVPLAWTLPSGLDSVANAARCTAPALFVHSGADEVVPLKYQMLVEAAYAGPVTSHTVAHAGHNDAVDPALLARWLADIAPRLEAPSLSKDARKE